MPIHKKTSLLVNADFIEFDESDITDFDGHEIAAAHFAVDRQVEQRQLLGLVLDLQSHSDRPTILVLEGRFLTGVLALVPGRVEVV